MTSSKGSKERTIFVEEFCFYARRNIFLSWSGFYLCSISCQSNRGDAKASMILSLVHFSWSKGVVFISDRVSQIDSVHFQIVLTSSGFWVRQVSVDVLGPASA